MALEDDVVLTFWSIVINVILAFALFILAVINYLRMNKLLKHFGLIQIKEKKIKQKKNKEIVQW